jgi:hypothetical protein
MRLNAITHARLMEESEARIENIARAGAPTQANIARRMLDDLQAYRRWEAEHDRLMRGIANGKNRMGQLAALRSTAFSLIHRKALFEYLRDQKVTGRKRHEVFRLVYGERDYAKSVVQEHGNYLRSASSWMCSSHLGLWVLSDSAFDTPLARYEQLYTDYLRAFIDSAIEYGPDASSASMRTLLPYLKQQLGQHRRTILRMEDTPIELRRLEEQYTLSDDPHLKPT